MAALTKGVVITSHTHLANISTTKLHIAIKLLSHGIPQDKNRQALFNTCLWGCHV